MEEAYEAAGRPSSRPSRTCGGIWLGGAIRRAPGHHRRLERPAHASGSAGSRGLLRRTLRGLPGLLPKLAHAHRLAYAVAKGESELRAYIDQWLTITEMDGFSQREFDRWILGRDPAARVSRWSVAKDVLGWIE
ncbi:MAG: hypothetical protein GY856_54725 [bacterium]|nr:hypothetical protein [bacterium]